MKPGTTAFTAALVGTDTDEATVRRWAASEGLLAGSTTEVQPGPNMYGHIDYITRSRNRRSQRHVIFPVPTTRGHSPAAARALAPHMGGL
jgi:hypothetical protein